jgi:DNA-directed RNA polymerase specialized sigma24 family protein
MVNLSTVSIKVTSVSLSELIDCGRDIPDQKTQADEYLEQEQVQYILSLLTKRQRQVVMLLEDYTRKEVAQQLTPKVSVQSIHQIILRIRKRIEERLHDRTRTY